MTNALEARKQAALADATTANLMAALLAPADELEIKERVSRAWMLEELVKRAGGISPEQKGRFLHAATLVLFPELRAG
jgi:hypothetical protein